MTSNIDPTKPVDGVAAAKSDLRANLAAAKAEIEALQARTTAVFDARDYGVVGDGSTNDGPALAAAFTAAVGGTLYIPKAATSYKISSGSHIITLSDNLRVLCDNVVFDMDHADSTTFIFSASEVLAPIYSGTSARGDFTVTVDSTTGVSPGDLLQINSTKIYETQWGYKQREVHTVESVTGTTITFAESLVFAYDSATDGVTLSVRQPHGLILEGPLKITYTSGTGRAIDLSGTKNSRLSGLELIDPTRRTNSGPDAVFMQYCMSTFIDNVFIDGMRYAVNVSSGCRDTYISDVVSQYTRHPVDFNTAAYTAFVENLSGLSNEATLSTHPAFDLHFKRVRCLEGQGYNHRCVGGSVEDFYFETSLAIGPNAALLQNNALTDNVYNQYDFRMENVRIIVPNATERLKITANENSRSIVFKNIHAPSIFIGTNGGTVLNISDCLVHDIKFRGSELFGDNIKMQYDYPGMPSGLRLAVPFSLPNATTLMLSNFRVSGGYDYLISEHYISNLLIDNFFISDIGIDLASSITGSGSNLYICFGSGVFDSCNISMANYNNEKIKIGAGVLYRGGTNKLRSHKRDAVTATTTASGTVTVAHGLYKAPTYAQVAIVGDVPYAASVESIDATNVVLRVAELSDGSDVASTSVTLHWEAEVLV